MSQEMVTVIVSAVTMGFVIGLFRAVDWIAAKYRNGKQQEQARQDYDTGVIRAWPRDAWSETTGEHRPVGAAECAQRHAQLTNKFEKLEEKLDSVEKAMIRLGNQVESGVELRILTRAGEAASNEVKGHEKRYHGRDTTTPTGGGRYPR